MRTLVVWLVCAGGLALSADAQRAGRDSGATVAAFSPRFIQVEGDTVWFVPSEEQGQTRVSMAGYVPRSGEWILRERAWLSMFKMMQPRTTSGGPHEPSRPDTLPYGWGLDDEWGGAKLDHLQSMLTGPGGTRIPVTVRLSRDSQRAIYRQGGGRRRTAPPFSTLVSRWAARDGFIALAMAAEPPPKPDAPWLPLIHSDIDYDISLSGLVLLDSGTKRLRAVTHPALVERDWIGLEIASGALWLAPNALADSDQTWADAPSLKPVPPLMRYDLRTRRWLTLANDAIPIEGITAMSSDGERLYFIGEDAIASMDARTRRWDVRYLIAREDTTVDGADTVITSLSTRPSQPPQRAQGAARDSAEMIADFARELLPRHLTRFEDALKRSTPYDSIEDVVGSMESQRGGRWDTGDPFVTETDRASALLARAEFAPYLREALSNLSTFEFALTTLAKIPGVSVREALRATMDSGPLPAAMLAADTLLRQGDSTAAEWLRFQLDHPERLQSAAPTMGRERWIDVVKRLLAPPSGRIPEHSPELLVVRATGANARAVAHRDGVLAVRERLEPLHAVEIDDDRPVYAHEPIGR